jgi:DNA-binding transcriptional LysR family regulator
MLDIRHIKHAMSLAEHGHFARAAEACHISQPAMTRSIQTLEKLLGVKLFHRQRGGVEPTEFGVLLIRRSADLVLKVEDIEREIYLTRNLELGTLVVGVGPYFAATLAGAIAAKLHGQSPKLQIKLLVASWSDFPELIQSRKVDLVFGELSEIKKKPDFETAVLPKLELRWVCRAGHPITKLKTIHPLDLTSYNLVGPALPKAFEAAFLSSAEIRTNSAWARSGLVAIECDSSTVLISLIKHSDTLSMMHECMIKEELSRGELVILPRLNDQIMAEYGVAWYGERALSSAGKTFVDMVLSQDLS